MDGNSTSIFLNDTSAADQAFIDTFTLVYDIVLSHISIVIISTNLIILSIYSRSEKIRVKSANLLLFNQALVDFYQGTVTAGITIFGHSEFVAKSIIYQFSLALNLHTVVLVSMERYVFILRPIFHKRNITTFRMRIAIIFSWFSSLIWIPFRLAHLTDPNIDAKSYVTYYIAISNTIFLLLILLMTYIHVSTFQTVRNFIKERYNKITNCNQLKSPNHHQQLKLRQHLRELRITKLFISMFISFIVSYLPLFITGVIHIDGASNEFSHRQIECMKIDVVLYLCNSVFNPIVTLTYKEDYKRVFKHWTKSGRRGLCSIDTSTDGDNTSEMIELKSSITRSQNNLSVEIK